MTVVSSRQGLTWILRVRIDQRIQVAVHTGSPALSCHAMISRRVEAGSSRFGATSRTYFFA